MAEPGKALLGGPGGQPSGPQVVYILVTKGVDVPILEERQVICSSGARYTREGVKQMFIMMGVKGRYAHKATQLTFAKLEKLASEPKHGSRHGPGSRQLWQVHPHGDGSTGQVYMSMPRSEFYELVCSSLTEYKYKYAPSSDEIKAACR